MNIKFRIFFGIVVILTCTMAFILQRQVTYVLEMAEAPIVIMSNETRACIRIEHDNGRRDSCDTIPEIHRVKWIN